MSSTSTTWTTDTNTKSGVVQVYESNVSVLKILGIEGGNSILELFADQGDDNADKWRMWVNASDDDLHFANYTSGAWADLLTIQDGGNVGIGTDSPGKLLTVEGASGAQMALITKDTSQSDGETLGTIYFQGSDTTISSPPTSGAQIIAQAAGAWDNSNSNDAPSELGFYTQSSATGANALSSPRMLIDSDGNVGIGTADPDGKPHIHTATAGSVTAVAGADELVLENSTNVGLSLLCPNSAVGNIFFGDPEDNDIGRIKYTHASNKMGFFTNAAEVMTILSSGDVGIGTTSPSTLLELEADTGAFDATDLSVNAILTLRNDQNTTNDGVGLFFSMHNTNPQDKGAGIIGKRTSDTNSEIQFITASSSTPSSKMTIKGGGNVGIGTADPDGILHVHEATAVAQARLTTNGAVNSHLYFITDADNSGSERLGHIGIDYSETVLKMVYGSSFDGSTNGIAIDSSGNVGIGTADPDGKLQVEGDAKFGYPAVTNAADVSSQRGRIGSLRFVADSTSSSLVFNSTSSSATFLITQASAPTKYILVAVYVNGSSTCVVSTIANNTITAADSGATNKTLVLSNLTDTKTYNVMQLGGNNYLTSITL